MLCQIIKREVKNCKTKFNLFYFEQLTNVLVIYSEKFEWNYAYQRCLNSVYFCLLIVFKIENFKIIFFVCIGFDVVF